MKLQASLGIALILAVALTGAGWMVLPSLQASGRTVHTEAGEHFERARRILQGFEPVVERKSVILDALYEAGVDVDIEDAEALADSASNEYEDEVKASWAAYSPMDWSERPREVKPSFGNIARDMEDAVSDRATMIEANRKALGDALAAVNDALSVSGGDADSRSFTEANRLKGIIEYHQGFTDWQAADGKRRQADRVRASLVDLAVEFAARDLSLSIVEDSGVDSQIRSLREEEAKTEQGIAERKSDLADLDSRIADLNQQIESATQAASVAERTMRSLRERGTGSGGAATFASSYEAADREFRNALRRMQTLQTGNYESATVHPRGDYLNGVYESGGSGEPTMTRGLKYYLDQRQVLAGEIDVLERGLEDFRKGIQRLEGVKSQLERQAASAKSEVPQILAEASELFDELSRIESEAVVMEDSAIKSFERAIKLAEQSVRNARQDSSSAGDRLTGVAPEHQGASAHSLLQQQRWIQGYLEAEIADAHLARAWIFYKRFVSAKRNEALLAEYGTSLKLAEADSGSEKQKAKEAHDAGVQAISEAMEHLSQAHKSADRHWTLVAHQGAANSLMALFGHPDYQNDAIQAYRNAVGGREDQAAAGRFVDYLTSLESK